LSQENSSNLPKNPKKYTRPSDDIMTSNIGNQYETTIGLTSKKDNKNTKAFPFGSNMNYDPLGASINARNYAIENPDDVFRLPKTIPFGKTYGLAGKHGASVFGWGNNLFQQDQIMMGKQKKQTPVNEALTERQLISGDFSVPSLSTGTGANMSYQKVPRVSEERGFSSLPFSKLISAGLGYGAANLLGNSRSLGFNTTGMTDKEMSNLNPLAQTIMNWRQGLEGIPNKWRPNQGESSAILSTALGGIPTYLGSQSLFDRVKVGDDGLSLGDYINVNATEALNKGLKAIGLEKILPKKEIIPPSLLEAQRLADEEAAAKQGKTVKNLVDQGLGDMVRPEVRQQYGY
jgi:hypothetical protein